MQGLIIRTQKRVVVEGAKVIKNEKKKKSQKDIDEFLDILEDMYEEIIKNVKRYR